MKQVLLVANPKAGSISTPRRRAIERRLVREVDLAVAQTERPDHATELAREAVSSGCDAVLAFGGDGTVNEVAQGLVGSDVAMGILPAGTANVIARGLGVPTDPVRASEFAAERLKAGKRRRINVGQVDDRYFIGSAGMGLDAEVVKRTEADPDAKQRWGEWLFVVHVLRVALVDYRGADPALMLEVEDEEPVRVVLAICCNLYPYTFLKRWVVDACPLTRLDADLDFCGLTELPLRRIGPVFYSLFRSRSHVDWATTVYKHDVAAAKITADRPMPLQIDGDFVGDVESADFRSVPDALPVLV